MAPSLLTRTPLVELRQMLEVKGIQVPENFQRDVIGAMVWLTNNGISLENIVFVRNKGKMYYRDAKLKLKQEIYERTSGTGSDSAEKFLLALGLVENRDTLVTLCLILDGKDVPFLDFPSTTLMLMDLPSAPEFLDELTMLATLGCGTGATSNPKRILPKKKNTSFKAFKFQKLPTEMRFMVYDLVFNEDRVVKVHLYKGYVKTTCPPPKLLHFSKESRDRFMNKYVKFNNLTYFNVDLDTLVIGRRFAVFNYAGENANDGGLIGSLLKLLPMEVIGGVKKVALGRSTFKLGDHEPHNVGAILAFTSLKSLYWIHDETARFATHHVMFKKPNTAEMGLVAATRAELVSAYADMHNNKALDEGFVIGEVDEIFYKV